MQNDTGQKFFCPVFSVLIMPAAMTILTCNIASGKGKLPASKKHRKLGFRCFFYSHQSHFQRPEPTGLRFPSFMARLRGAAFFAGGGCG